MFKGLPAEIHIAFQNILLSLKGCISFFHPSIKGFLSLLSRVRNFLVSANGETRGNLQHDSFNDHEEADTLIIHQIITASTSCEDQVTVFCSDTDVFILMLCYSLCIPASMYMQVCTLTSKNNSKNRVFKVRGPPWDQQIMKVRAHPRI